MNLRTCLFASLALLLAACNPDAVVDFPADAEPAGRDAAMPPDAEEAGEDASAVPGPDAQQPGPDAGRADAGPTAGPDAALQDVIKVTCTGPAHAIPVNTRVDVTCQVDNGGRATATPVLQATPAAGVVFTRGTSDTQLNFSLSTSAPGYLHPLDFADTEVTLTYEVHDAADPSRFGRATVTVSLLGNYWVGDSHSNSGSSGVLVYTSNGAPLGQAVGVTQIKGVYDIRNLPDGTLIVSSYTDKTLRIFDRQGNAKAVTFPDTDPFNGVKIWEPTGYDKTGPSQMAVTGDEVWVAGAKEAYWGLAVFNWKTGAFLRFVPTPQTDVNNTFAFTSLVRRNDGVILAGSAARKVICAFDEKTYAALPGTPCVTLGADFCQGWASFALLSTGEVAAVEKGDQTNDGCPVMVLGPTLNMLRSKNLPEGNEVYGLLESGGELVGISWSQISVAQSWFLRVNPTTLDSTFSEWWPIKPPPGLTLMAPRGLARLTKL